MLQLININVDDKRTISLFLHISHSPPPSDSLTLVISLYQHQPLPYDAPILQISRIYTYKHTNTFLLAILPSPQHSPTHTHTKRDTHYTYTKKHTHTHQFSYVLLLHSSPNTPVASSQPMSRL